MTADLQARCPQCSQWFAAHECPDCGTDLVVPGRYCETVFEYLAHRWPAQRQTAGPEALMNPKRPPPLSREEMAKRAPPPPDYFMAEEDNTPHPGSGRLLKAEPIRLPQVVRGPVLPESQRPPWPGSGAT